MKYLLFFFFFRLFHGYAQVSINKDSLKQHFSMADSLSYSAGSISEYPENQYYLFSDSAMIEGSGIKIRSDEMKLYYVQLDEYTQHKKFNEAHIYNIAYFLVNSKQIQLPPGYKKCIFDVLTKNYIFIFE